MYIIDYLKLTKKYPSFDTSLVRLEIELVLWETKEHPSYLKWKD
jgi:hypothetical protein